MKKYIFTLFLLLIGLCVSAQSSYKKNLDDKGKKIALVKTTNECDKLFAEFSTLKNSKDEYKWKAYYYAAFTLYQKGEIIIKSGKKADLKSANALAEKYVLGSLTSQPNDTENKELLNLIKLQREKI